MVRGLTLARSIRITGGIHRGRRIRSGPAAGLRPTADRVRSAIFSILGEQTVHRAQVLDLYAGTGAMGMEALSRGAAWADFVETNTRLARRMVENLDELSMAPTSQVHPMRVERALGALTRAYDLVFADPPYDMDVWAMLLGHLGGGRLIGAGGFAVIEHSRDAEFEEDYGMLRRVDARRYGDTAITIFRAREAE